MKTLGILLVILSIFIGYISDSITNQIWFERAIGFSFGIFLYGIFILIKTSSNISFKRNKIRILRKKLKDKKWIKSEVKILLLHSRNMNDFRRFECSTFFRGYQNASRNIKWANKREKQINRQLKFLESFL